MLTRYQTFHLGDLLSVTTPYLLAPTLMDGVESLLTHVTGEPRESDLHMVEMSLRVREVLIRQHPWLTHCVAPETDDRNEVVTWFAQQVVERGAYHDVAGVDTTIDEAVDDLEGLDGVETAETAELVNDNG